jgi:hypothetical protein
VVARLPHEPDHGCLQTALRVLSQWDAAAAAATAAETWGEWDVMRALTDSSHLRVQQEAVRCLGGVLRRLLHSRDEAADSDRWLAALADWAERTRRFSEPVCSDSLREAMAHALSSSGYVLECWVPLRARWVMPER